MKRYIIWAWKEDYINLGAGAETGIMELLLTDRQGNIILDYKPEEEQWWINGFNPQKQNVQENELISTTRIDFSNNLDMWNALYNDELARKKWDFDEANHIAILRW